MAEDLSLRVLVLAQFGRDGELLRTFLQRHGFHSQIVANSDEFFNEMERGAATALITEESLTLPIKQWSKRLEMQPTWSDFPLIILISPARGQGEPPAGLAALRVLGNVTLVERPIRFETLLSAVEAAMRARMRQYEVRDFMSSQARSQDALRRTEKLAVAGRLAASLAHEINNPLTSVTNLLFLVRSAHDVKEAQHWAGLAEDELRRVSDIANHTLRFHRSNRGCGTGGCARVAGFCCCAVPRQAAKPKHTGERRLRKRRADGMRPGRNSPGISQPYSQCRGCNADRRQFVFAGSQVPTSENLSRRSTDFRGGPRNGYFQSYTAQDVRAFFHHKGDTGTGLGLWLTKDIIDRHQGLIQVRNHNHPRGAVFSIWLPEKPAKTNVAQAES